ncbi:hypothetical protein [Nostoc sp. CHAB 5715]|uniref:hypothetical protein n=1 Tax=Nostoc sp. CHAB 5715 TaxID=2780400 RepID=UPI001E59CD1A|nr:hypothetical protein [Nostoc sp. CHAB 5715]MCC5620279.1 hypothetical protein [Nostoc sp. CHAB 5715]
MGSGELGMGHWAWGQGERFVTSSHLLSPCHLVPRASFASSFPLPTPHSPLPTPIE